MIEKNNAAIAKVLVDWLRGERMANSE
jgi:hypothetical protein